MAQSAWVWATPAEVGCTTIDMAICYTYILRCADDTLYTGWTTDLKRRVADHNAGRGGRYTRARRPVELVYWEAWDTPAQAMRRESAIKKLSRTQKLQLITECIPQAG